MPSKEIDMFSRPFRSRDFGVAILESGGGSLHVNGDQEDAFG